MVRSYVELIRPANVATAIADVLAGYAVAGLAAPRAVALLLPATACLYAGGIVFNDVFDRAIDSTERPERPIPSGRIGATQAAVFGGALLSTGVGLAFLANATAGLTALAIAGAVLLYDAWSKHHGLVGPVNMGLCRALNLLLGIAAVPAAVAWAWPLTALPLVYIAAVTALSRGEVAGGTRVVAGFALISLTLVGVALLLLTFRAEGWSPAGTALTLLLGWRVLPAYWAAYRTPEAPVIRRAIRTGVLSLVLLDAVLGAVYGGPLYALVIVATAVVAGWLARSFEVT